MKLGTLKTAEWGDGKLVVVSKDNKTYIEVPNIARSLREALESWLEAKPRLTKTYEELNAGSLQGAKPLDEKLFHSPLPRSFQWADGSAFLYHVKLVRMARNAEMPESLYKVPLMYQGGSVLLNIL